MNVIVVNSNLDTADLVPADGVCDSDPAPGEQCTLRAAIQTALGTAVVDAIGFDSSMDIVLSSSLPHLTEASLIIEAAAGQTVRVDLILVYEVTADPTQNGGGGIYHADLTVSDAGGVWSIDLEPIALASRPVSFVAVTGFASADSSPMSPVTQLAYELYLPVIAR